MVGVAMPFSLARRQAQGASFGDLFGHVGWRALLLIALSNLFSNFGEDHLQLQLINVLSQIAFGYVICLPFNPVIKRLWSASFTFLSAAWVIAMMIALFWAIDVRGWKKWTSWAPPGRFRTIWSCSA